MHYIVIVILLICLSMIAFEDFKDRTFRIVWLLVMTISIIYLQYNILSLKHIAYNFSFMLLNLLGVSLFFSIKEKRIINIINSKMGLGDILYFIPLCFMFSTLNLMAFFFLSVFVALLYGIILLFIKKDSLVKIPLAGVFSANLLTLVLLNGLETAIFFNNVRINGLIETILPQ